MIQSKSSSFSEDCYSEDVPHVPSDEEPSENDDEQQMVANGEDNTRTYAESSQSTAQQLLSSSMPQGDCAAATMDSTAQTVMMAGAPQHNKSVSRGPVNITLTSGNVGFDEKAEISINVNDPDTVVDRMLRTLANKFPAEAVLTIASGLAQGQTLANETEALQAMIADQRRQIEELNAAAMGQNFGGQVLGSSAQATSFGQQAYPAANYLNVTGQFGASNGVLVQPSRVGQMQTVQQEVHTGGDGAMEASRVTTTTTSGGAGFGALAYGARVTTDGSQGGALASLPGQFMTSTTTSGQTFATAPQATLYSQVTGEQLMTNAQGQLVAVGKIGFEGNRVNSTGSTTIFPTIGGDMSTSTSLGGSFNYGAAASRHASTGGAFGRQMMAVSGQSLAGAASVTRTGQTTVTQGPIMSQTSTTVNQYESGKNFEEAMMMGGANYSKQLSQIYGIPLNERVVSAVGEMNVLSERMVSSVQISQEYPQGQPSQEEQVQYVEVDVIEEVIREVPVKQYVEVEKRVPKIQVEYVDKIVEVPDVRFVDKQVTVEQIQEVIRHVTKKQIIDVPKEVIRTVPRIETVVVEKCVEVPGQIIENPVPFRVERKVAVPVMRESEVATVVAQKLIPIIGEGTEVYEVDMNEFDPVLIPVEIYIPVPVSVPVTLGKVVQVDHKCVDVPMAHYNSLLKVINASAVSQAHVPYFVELSSRNVPMLPLNERVEIVEPIAMNWKTSRRQGQIHCVGQSGYVQQEGSRQDIEMHLATMFDAENTQVFQMAQQKAMALVTRSSTTTMTSGMPKVSINNAMQFGVSQYGQQSGVQQAGFQQTGFQKFQSSGFHHSAGMQPSGMQSGMQGSTALQSGSYIGQPGMNMSGMQGGASSQSFRYTSTSAVALPLTNTGAMTLGQMGMKQTVDSMGQSTMATAAEASRMTQSSMSGPAVTSSIRLDSKSAGSGLPGMFVTSTA